MWTELDKEQIKKDGVIILLENCNPIQSKDKSLPTDSYLVTYEFKGKICYDIVQSSKRVKIFDSYYDKIGNGIKSFEWTDGRTNPRIYGESSKPEKRRR